jgi:glycine/D-amino acid oxidase-like deaminating enzyme
MAVVGGGLAGLSTVYHYLEKAESCEVTVFDAASPGQGGASSVAGG